MKRLIYNLRFMLAALLKAWKAAPQAAYKAWLIYTWPVVVHYGKWRCAFNFHDWEEAPQLDHRGEIKGDVPPRFLRCKRCHIYHGAPALVRVQQWQELDNMMAIARTNCAKCMGRGYSRKMQMPGGVLAQIPCDCIRIQPCFVERVRPKEEQRSA